MPLYMDVHRKTEGMTPDALREAHFQDLAIQERYGVHYHRYFFDEASGSVYCLVEGPSAEACHAVHAASHGLEPDEIIEVQPELVQLFFAATKYDENGAAITGDGRPDGGLRVIMFTELANFTEVARESEADAAALLQCHDRVVRAALLENDGHEVRHTGEGIMAVFHSVTPALNAARRIQRGARDYDTGTRPRPLVRVGLSAGEPVAHHEELFGAAVNTARRICELAEPGQILVSGALRELGVGRRARFSRIGERALKGVDESITLFALEWRGPGEAAEPAALRRVAETLARFRDEIGRRRVARALIAYSFVLFAVLQVADLTLEPLGMPEGSYDLVVILGLLGFPVAALLAWAFDVTATGIRRTAALEEQAD